MLSQQLSCCHRRVTPHYSHATRVAIPNCYCTTMGEEGKTPNNLSSPRTATDLDKRLLQSFPQKSTAAICSPPAQMHPLRLISPKHPPSETHHGQGNSPSNGLRLPRRTALLVHCFWHRGWGWSVAGEGSVICNMELTLFPVSCLYRGGMVEIVVVAACSARIIAAMEGKKKRKERGKKHRNARYSSSPKVMGQSVRQNLLVNPQPWARVSMG